MTNWLWSLSNVSYFKRRSAWNVIFQALRKMMLFYWALEYQNCVGLSVPIFTFVQNLAIRKEGARQSTLAWYQAEQDSLLKNRVRERLRVVVKYICRHNFSIYLPLSPVLRLWGYRLHVLQQRRIFLNGNRKNALCHSRLAFRGDDSLKRYSINLALLNRNLANAYCKTFCEYETLATPFFLLVWWAQKEILVRITKANVELSNMKQ